MLSYVVSKDHSKPVLWLNFDETAVARSPEALRGCVVSRKEWKGQVKGPHRKVRKDRQRGKYTYCATICDNSAVQAVLPQFLIGKSTYPLAEKIGQGVSCFAFDSVAAPA